MAEYNENLIKFGWLTKEEMLQAIADGNLNEYDICFTNDSHEQYLINSNLEPVSIKSRLRIYATVESALADIKTTSQTYPGEIISIRDGEKFIAYIVNQFENGDYYLSPIYTDKQVNYNELQNAPIKNLDGSVLNPIKLADLDDGHYKITGHFITPDNKEITSIVGNYIIVESEINSKHIKRINSQSIVDFDIVDGQVQKRTYATDKYIADQGFATEDYVDSALLVFKTEIENYIKNYVETTCTYLIKHIVNEELDLRYSTNDDINNLFN